MSHKHKRILKSIFAEPASGNLHWREVESLLHHLGATLEPLSVFGPSESIRPSAEALLDRFYRNFSGQGVPKSEHPEPLLCDVSLSIEEARRALSDDAAAELAEQGVSEALMRLEARVHVRYAGTDTAILYRLRDHPPGYPGPVPLPGGCAPGPKI